MSISRTTGEGGTDLRQRDLLRGSLSLAMVLGLLASLGVAPVSAGSFVRDVYFAAGYERQVDSRTCTAASTAMMLNFIGRRDFGFNQLNILRWEQAHDALDDAVQRGSDPLGWSSALTRYSTWTGKPAFTYRWEAYSSESAALKRAVQAIATTRMPIGLLVYHGTHAMVMTGFEASADPRTGPYKLLNVWVSDPKGYAHRSYAGTDSPLSTYLELDATLTYDRAWYGKYIIIAPAT